MATKKVSAQKTTSPARKTPTKKVVPVSAKSTRSSSNGIFDYFRFGESYTSLILGMVVVIIATILLVAFFKNRNINSELNPRQDISATSLSPAQQRTYVVKEGDTLWSISVSQLHDGYRWREILVANNMSQATDLEKGSKLIIPNSKSTAPGNTTGTDTQQVSVAPTQTPQVSVVPSVGPTDRPYFPNQNQPTPSSEGAKIMTSSYTVKEGDYLWEIAIRAYGDGYKWVEIASKNNLLNPDLIYVGSVLQLPR